MKVAMWNVNSVRARLPRVVEWLTKTSPDVVCLQETKVEDVSFPHEEFRNLGYQTTIYGQRTYNGVAILSRNPVTDVVRGFGDQDPEARYIIGTVNGIRVASAYIPNGKAVGTDKFAYKLDWLARWRRWLSAHVRADEPLALCGDYNIAPDDRDVYDPEGWKDQVLCHPDERAALTLIKEWGVQDVFRNHHTEAGLYSWWDYRQLGFPKNRGLRIDYLLCTKSLADRCIGAHVDREARKGKEPSDHAPVVAEFKD